MASLTLPVSVQLGVHHWVHLVLHLSSGGETRVKTAKGSTSVKTALEIHIILQFSSLSCAHISQTESFFFLDLYGH